MFMNQLMKGNWEVKMKVKHQMKIMFPIITLIIIMTRTTTTVTPSRMIKFEPKVFSMYVNFCGCFEMAGDS